MSRPLFGFLMFVLIAGLSNIAFADCFNPAAPPGKLIYNADENVPQICAGSTWIALGKLNPGAGGSGCSSPTGTEGQVIYNNDIHIPQYCDGSSWVAMIGRIRGCTAPNSCSNAGDICADGSIFAGFNIVGDQCYSLFVTDDKQSASIAWDPDNTANLVDPADYQYGLNNAIHFTSAISQSPAMETCDVLDQHGHQDWYLPAPQELAVIWNNRAAINASATDQIVDIGTGYWSSYEISSGPSTNRPIELAGSIDGTFTGGSGKTSTKQVRCVRSVASPGISSASGSCAVSEPIPAPDAGTYNFYNSLWGDGNYIYTSPDSPALAAYSFDGSTISVLNTVAIANGADSIWGDGTYLYYADGLAGIGATTFNGTNFSAPVTYNTADTAYDIWGDGTYIYVAHGLTGVEAYSFDGSAFTLLDTYNTPDTAKGVWGDGTYVYVADGNTIIALTFNGTTFSLAGSYDYPGTTATKISGDGTYIYVAEEYDGMEALTFNGSTFTSVGNLSKTVINVRFQYGYVHTTTFATGIMYTFNGSQFVLKGYFPRIYGATVNMFSDGNYEYVLDEYDGLLVYDKCN